MLTVKPPYWKHINHSNSLAKGLVGCWPFNEGTGNIARDASGRKNHGTFSGTLLWQPGNRGHVIQDNRSGYIEIDTVIDDFNIEKGTFVASAREAHDPWNNTGDLLYLFNISNPSDGSGVFIYLTGTSLIFRYKGSGISKSVTKDTSSVTGWHGLALTWDTTKDEAKAYWDGEQEGDTLTGLTAWGAQPSVDDLLGALHSPTR